MRQIWWSYLYMSSGRLHGAMGWLSVGKMISPFLIATPEEKIQQIKADRPAKGHSFIFGSLAWLDPTRPAVDVPAPLSAKERIHRHCRNFANRNRGARNSWCFTIGNPLATIAYRKTHTSDNHLDHRLEFAPLYVHIVNRPVPSPSHRCCSSTNWYENVYEWVCDIAIFVQK